MYYPDGYFIRVTDDVKPRREYTIAASSFDEKVHKPLDKAAVAADGTPLPPKYTPESMGPADSSVPPTELPPYDERTVPQLKDEIQTRNASRPESEHIPTSGNKAALVEALEADDESYVPGAGEVEEPAPDGDDGAGGDTPADDHESLSDNGQ